MRLHPFAAPLVAAILVTASIAAVAQESESTGPRKLPRPEPGILDTVKDSTGVNEIIVNMNLGDLNIVANPTANQIHLNVRSARKEQEGAMDAWVKEFTVSGGIVYVKLKMPKESNGRSGTVTLYLPAQAKLRAHLGIGDLHVSGISGDKQVEVGIGDLTISSPAGESFAEVHADTGIGDLNDSVNHGKTSGWLGKTEKAFGAGPYRLQAHVGIGDLNIVREKPAEKE